MAKVFYVGVGSKARKIKKLYVGIGGKARKVKKAYVGIGGKARQFYSAGFGTGADGLYAFDMNDHILLNALNKSTFVKIRSVKLFNGATDWSYYDEHWLGVSVRGFGTSGMLVGWYYTGYDSDDGLYNPQLVELDTTTGGVTRILQTGDAVRKYIGGTTNYLIRGTGSMQSGKFTLVNPANMADVGTMDITAIVNASNTQKPAVYGSICGDSTSVWVPFYDMTNGRYRSFHIFKRINISNNALLSSFTPTYPSTMDYACVGGNIDDLGDCWAALCRGYSTTTFYSVLLKKINKNNMADISSYDVMGGGELGDMSWVTSLVTVK